MKPAMLMITAAAALLGSTSLAQPPRKTASPAAPVTPAAPAKPYELRGIPLGITLEEFRALPPIDGEGKWDHRTLCTGDHMPHGLSFSLLTALAPTELGVIGCEWFSRAKEEALKLEGSKPKPWEPLARHWIDLGEGSAHPSFEFISDGVSMRMFRILIQERDGYADVHSALTRKYGPARERTASFQTQAGAIFANLISTWSNGTSRIVLEQLCERTDRYCLTYRHEGLGKIYDALLEKRAAAAASKI